MFDELIRTLDQLHHDAHTRGFLTFGQIIQLRAASDRICTAMRGNDSMTLIDVTDDVRAPEV